MKRREDVITACYEGADAIGFIIGATHKTEDEISVEHAKSLLKCVPPFITPVMVTHFTSPESVISLIEILKITAVQIQGDMSPEEIVKIKSRLPYVTVIKAVHVVDKASIDTAKQYSKVADAILLDSKTSERIGGTGLTHDWSISAEIVKAVDVPVILAGGLNPDNVREAIRVVNPYGVDVNTGTKGVNGFKDPEKIRAFIQNAKGINNRSYTH